jgi:AraC-like DNA-binding protein
VDPVYRSRLVPLFLREFADRGGNAVRIKAAFGLPDDAEQAPEVVVPIRAIEEIADEMATALGDRDLGLNFALGLRRGRLGLIEFLWESSGTLGESIQGFLRHQNALSRFAVHSLDVQGEVATFRQTVAGHPRCLGRHGNEFGMVLLKRIGTALLGEEARPRRVWFAHPAPRDTRALESFFGRTPIEFGAGFNGFEWSSQFLSRPLARSDSELHRALTAQLDATGGGSDAGFPALVRRMIDRALEERRPQIGRVAKLLHLSPRTLQRRLGELGTSFQSLLDEARHEASRVQLRMPHATVEQVARALGYARVSTFARAFKRWTGRSPSELLKSGR